LTLTVTKREVEQVITVLSNSLLTTTTTMIHTTRSKDKKSRGHHTGPAAHAMASSGTKPQRFSGSTTYHMTSGTRGVEAVRKIRLPHPNDILCGRGGSINNHPGNKIYRTWVHERKNSYNLAVNKSEKARISREIINLVQSLDPPGRFLTKDPDSTSMVGSTTMWVEIDDVKAMAKTSQALREGAPAIRATHKPELGAHKLEFGEEHSFVRSDSRGGSCSRKASRKAPHPPTSMPPPVAPVSLSSDLGAEALTTAAEAAKHGMGHVGTFMSNAVFLQSHERPSKKARMREKETAPTPPLETPPLKPVSSEEPKAYMSLDKTISMKREHSLSLSEVESGDLSGEFVNPFEDESDYGNGNNFKYQIPSLVRSTADSTISIGNSSFGSLLNKSSSGLSRQWGSGNNSTPGTAYGADIRKNISSRSVSVDEGITCKTSSLSNDCFCECGSPLEEGKVCPCSTLADHLAWRDDGIEGEDWLHISGFYDQIVPYDHFRPVSPEGSMRETEESRSGYFFEHDISFHTSVSLTL
jgi:hypothetical protein